MSNVTKPPVLNETYERLMSEQNALLRVIAQDKMANLTKSWNAISHLSKAGETKNIFNIGDMLTDTWKDVADNKEYNFDWHIAHFADMENKLGESVPGMIIQMHWAHPFGVQFSHPRAFLACPDGLAAGQYYFTIESKYGEAGNVLAGDAVSFKLANAVPAGGRIAGLYQAPDNKKANWRVYVYSADGKDVLETVTPTFEVAGTSLGTMHSSTREGNLNSMQETAYGWNRWKTSAMRQYLNSSAEKGKWWEAQDQWDIAPEQLATKAGFLSGLPEDMVSAIRLTKVTTYTNTVQDGGEADVTWDKIFLPALEQMFITPQIAGEGETWEYWKAVNGTGNKWNQYGTYPELIHHAVENHTSAQVVRLRSAHRGYANYTWYVSASGGVYGGGASWARRFSAACGI